MTKQELIQKMAEKIVQVEFNGRHSWNSCMQSRRDSSLLQAKALLEMLEVEKYHHWECPLCSISCALGS